jgi:hypothetical protein
MPLLPLKPQPSRAPLPHEVRRFLTEAGKRIDAFQESHLIPGFVPSDFAQVYRVLDGLAESDLVPGRWFCEWGSGFGVVACLAALLGFDAWGIEAEEELVDAARLLAADFDLPVTFACGSFLPPPAAEAQCARNYAWLTTHGDSGYEELGLGPDDFDVIFAYPWPDEEHLTGDLFRRYARRGAVLVTYHGGEDVRLRRKDIKKAGGRGRR